jgi:putative PIN family toxin of toxin-antitoxin system
MRVVLDTSVLVAGLRSPGGASSVLLDTVLSGVLQPIVSVPLALEYEAVLTRSENLEAFNISTADAVGLVKAFCKQGIPVHMGRSLRPQLRDADDEFVLETAIYGHADVIVSFNCRDFLPAATRFGIEVLLPGSALGRLNL